MEKVDVLLRNGRAIEALDYVDSIVLKGYLGFDTPIHQKHSQRLGATS
ncbi:MAG: hypothetical protein GY796_01405 [Chloroflexi bacterium]|nr:hypothetical protein [Chloroflexota bacterium]